MPHFYLAQAVADALLAVNKKSLDNEQYIWNGGKLEIPLISITGQEHFLLNINKAKIEINKGSYQTRAQSVIILVRLDFGPNVRHANPDGQWIVGPHIHLYRESYADKWAFPLPPVFNNIDNPWLTLFHFMEYCNVSEPPNIERRLFI